MDLWVNMEGRIEDAARHAVQQIRAGACRLNSSVLAPLVLNDRIDRFVNVHGLIKDVIY